MNLTSSSPFLDLRLLVHTCGRIATGACSKDAFKLCCLARAACFAVNFLKAFVQRPFCEVSFGGSFILFCRPSVCVTIHSLLACTLHTHIRLLSCAMQKWCYVGTGLPCMALHRNHELQGVMRELASLLILTLDLAPEFICIIVIRRFKMRYDLRYAWSSCHCFCTEYCFLFLLLPAERIDSDHMRHCSVGHASLADEDGEWKAEAGGGTLRHFAAETGISENN